MIKRPFVLCLLLVPAMSPAEGVIDTTSLKTIHQSCDGEKAEDVAIIKEIVCDAGDFLIRGDAKSLELALAHIRERLNGKTVKEVASEVRAGREAKKSQLLQAGDDIARERKARWHQRAAHIPEIVPGLSRERVLELMGEPDGKSDSPTTQNWRYRYDANRHGEQVWTESIHVELVDGIVTKVAPKQERRGIEQYTMKAPGEAVSASK